MTRLFFAINGEISYPTIDTNKPTTSSNMDKETFSPLLDKLLASLLTLTLVLGVPLNLLSFSHFYNNHRTSTSKLIYMIVSLTDTFSCLNTYPVVFILYSGRDSVLFKNYTFTQIWGITWEPLPYFSVFLVFVMTTVRAIILIKPLVTLSRKLIIGCIVGYYIFLVLRFSVGLILFGHYQYRTFSGYAWIQINSAWYGKVDISLAVILLATPILPILILSSISVYKIVKSIRTGTKNKRLAAIKRKSSITVVIFTTIYVIFNLPVFFTYVWFVLMTQFQVNILEYNWFLHNYLWIMTYVCCVALNALCNPVVFLCRMTEFRKYLSSKLERRISITSNNSVRDVNRRFAARSVTLENVHATTQL